MNKIVPFERNAEYLHRRAMLGRREGRLLDALALFRRAVEREPGNLTHRMDMAQTLCEMGCYVESNRMLAGMLPLTGAPDDCYFGLCCNYFGMNELEKAFGAMVQFLACDPEALSREEVSNMFRNLVLTRALNEAKNRRAVRVTRLLSHANEKLKSGELSAVEACSRRALGLGFKRQAACVLLAQSLAGQGRTAEAAHAIGQALKSANLQFRTLYTAVLVYMAAGDGAAAQAAYAQMKPAAEDAEERRLMLEAACAMGDDERVRALLPRALGSAPYDRSLLHICAVNRVREGRAAEQAIPFWTRMLLIDPSDPVARHWLRKAEQGALDNAMPYEYALPLDERKRRAAALTRWQWQGDAQLQEAWRKQPVKDLMSWAVRGTDREEALLAQALLGRIDSDDARSLLCEGMLDRGKPATRTTTSWPIRGNGKAVMTIGGPADFRVPIGVRKAIKMAMRMARPCGGDVPAAVVRLALGRSRHHGCIALPRDAASWAAALVALASAEVGRKVPLRTAAKIAGCPLRRAARCARLLGNFRGEEK